MTTSEGPSDLDRAARRAVLIDGTPVVLLGGVALTLGSTTDPARRGLWIAATVAFTLSVVWVVYRAFRRADEYQRKIQLESMAVSFAVVLVALQVAGSLDAAGIGDLRQYFQLIVVGGTLSWLLLADLRTRLSR